jgi:hypothetical protein
MEGIVFCGKRRTPRWLDHSCGSSRFGVLFRLLALRGGVLEGDGIYRKRVPVAAFRGAGLDLKSTTNFFLGGIQESGCA